jgi:hypothetical protein
MVSPSTVGASSLRVNGRRRRCRRRIQPYSSIGESGDRARVCRGEHELESPMDVVEGKWMPARATASHARAFPHARWHGVP